MDGAYDVIVIGSGAGGATLAADLAVTGKEILVLERGPRLPVEAENWNAREVFVHRRYRTTEEWVDRHGRNFRPTTHYYVGGNTSFYGAALMRMKRRDFDALPHYGGGVSPAWPLDYDDFKLWYGAAERLWEVRGQRGADPHDEPGDPPYPHPPLRHDPGVSALKAHWESLGWRPSCLPLGLRRDDEAPDQSLCIRCRTCGGFPCRNLAKVDARTTAIARLDAALNVTLLPGRKVIRIETSPDGRCATGVTVIGPDSEERYSADMVVCAAGAANSAALFLASANAAHPHGLANGSGAVGRHYMFHMTSAVLSIAAEKFDAAFPKTLSAMDFYFGENDFPWPMGQIQLLEYMSGQTLEGEIADQFPPGLLPDAFTNAVADRMVSFLAMSEDLPDPDNRVTLAPDGRIRLSYTYGDTTAHERLVKKLERSLDGFTTHRHALLEHRFEVDSLLPLYGTAHQCGTLRFGRDPRSSVLNTDCRAHEIDNLYVVDSSFFPSSAAVNPTLTIVANALRVGAHLRDRLHARPLTV